MDRAQSILAVTIWFSSSHELVCGMRTPQPPACIARSITRGSGK
jgi:hypothetical protein